ncbi:hypothetical protein [Candidatus Pantoea persica]|uniref:hypothetical protein n=1 Tax=Candidatus Pantoea persica TaxID=2518128 RepID=UPI00215DAB2C|nr:hypothetical protein [Candidatus Pantoea persica]MBA2813978.1 stress response protein ysnf [Candidatus Pantoea persica]
MEMIKAGFAEHDIDVISCELLKSEGHEARHPSFWQRLFGETVDEEQRGVYEDAINSGSIVLMLRAKEEQLPRANSILDAHDTGDFQSTSASAAWGRMMAIPSLPRRPSLPVWFTTTHAVRPRRYELL